MNANEIIMVIMAVFFVIGALDRMAGNKLGMGSEFQRGFLLMGTIALSIIGLQAIAPVLATVIKPVVVPLYTALGADAAMFSSTFFAPDSGGWAIAHELSDNELVADFSGLVVAAVMGGVVSFSIPTAVGLIEPEDTKYLAVGIMSAFIADPVGCFFGGLTAGLDAMTTLHNLVPVAIFAVLFAVGLRFIPKKMIRGFQVFAKILLIIITIGLSLAAFTKMAGMDPIGGMRPIDDCFKIVGSVTIMVAGALPLVYLIEKLAQKPLKVLARKTGISENTFTAMMVSLGSIVPSFTNFKYMNVKGKIIMATFAGSVSNMLGAHLGFASGTNPDMILPMVVAKLAAGVLAIPLGLFFGMRLFRKEAAAERAALSGQEGNESC